MLFTVPEDANWNADRQAVEFGVEIGEFTQARSGSVGAYFSIYSQIARRPNGVLRHTTCTERGSR
jgi:hypothetical protein